MEGRTILVVDGETDSRRHAASILRNGGYDVQETGAAAEALRAARSEPPDVVLVDLALSDADPEQLIRTLSAKHPDTEIMLTTRQHEPPRQFRQLDVSDYIEKPVDAEELLTKMRMLDLRREFHQRFQLLGKNERFIAAMDSVLQVAPTGIQVLLTGESGTGKEGFARAIHHYSDRRDGPFIPINCGAIAEGVLESELFGHEKGAFTDAKGQRKGYFEQANGGTLLLDEIGDMPRSTQVKLLRVLEQQEFIRVGGSTPVKTDVRLIASTNRDLSGDIHDGTFRQDLYYRLNAVHIHLPALRERRDDIPRLIGHFMRHAPGKPGAPPPVFTEEALAALSDYDWPGNIRELRHLVESLVVTSGKARIDAEDLPDSIYTPPMANRALPVPQNRDPQDMDREMFYKILWQILTAIHELPAKISTALGRGPEQLPERFQLPPPRKRIGSSKSLPRKRHSTSNRPKTKRVRVSNGTRTTRARVSNGRPRRCRPRPDWTGCVPWKTGSGRPYAARSSETKGTGAGPHRNSASASGPSTARSGTTAWTNTPDPLLDPHFEKA